MITFTNESADAMKEKLSDNFLNYYLLTKDIKYLGYIEKAAENIYRTISHKVNGLPSSNKSIKKNLIIPSGTVSK